MKAAGLLAAEAVASADKVFAVGISDHLPQVFRILYPELVVDVEVFCWNIMARGRSGLSSSHSEGTAAWEALDKNLSIVQPPQQHEQAMLTNNGLDLDETIGSYEKRLSGDVVPLIARWITAKRLRRAAWIVCLQEAPAHPEHFRDLKRSVGTSAGMPDGTLQHADLQRSYTARSVTLWDAERWELRHCAHAEGDVALCTVLASVDESRRSPSPILLRVLNCHFPFQGEDEKAVLALRGLKCNFPFRSEGEKALSAPAGILAKLLTEAPVGQLALAVGDMNFDIEDVDSESFAALARRGCVRDSAIYRGQRITRDAAVLMMGTAETETLKPVPPSLADGSSEDEDPLRGLSRNEFIKQSINVKLQARVQELSALCGRALADLGAHHFGDQAEKLAEWQAANPEDKEHEDADTMSGFFAAAGGREAYIKDHIHRKLQKKTSELGDRELSILGGGPLQRAVRRTGTLDGPRQRPRPWPWPRCWGWSQGRGDHWAAPVIPCRRGGKQPGCMLATDRTATAAAAEGTPGAANAAYPSPDGDGSGKATDQPRVLRRPLWLLPG